MVFDYIETFYNTRRRHGALDYRSPAQSLIRHYQMDLLGALRLALS